MLQRNRGPRIDGLKQIARYCGWDSTTTVKKYYDEHHLPLRTLGSSAKPRYWAWSGELDAWIEGQSGASEEVAPLSTAKSSTAAGRRKQPRTSLLLASAATVGGLIGALAIAVAGYKDRAIAERYPAPPRQSDLGSSAPGDQGPTERELPTLIDREAGGLSVRIGEEILWEHNLLGSTTTSFLRLGPNERPLLAGVIATDVDRNLDFARLLLLDPWTKDERLPSVPLEPAAPPFPEYSTRFGVRQLNVLDLDDDGIDELLLTFHHSPNWPGYTMLYEPARGRLRMVYSSTGHHTLVGLQDLDGNGQVELLFEGPNNLMGWRSGLAAVRLSPWLDDGAMSTLSAGSPNRDFRLGANNTLVWYTVGSHRGCANADPCIEIDASTRTIRGVAGVDRGRILDFDGFDLNVPSRPREERIAARDRVYALVRESDRMVQRDQAHLAPDLVREALNLAQSTGLPKLASWLRFLEIRALALAGRDSEVRERVASWPQAASSEYPDSFEIALAFHTAGFAADAATWYERGLQEGSTEFGSGRPAWEYLRGLVLSLVDAGRFQDARERLVTYADIMYDYEYGLAEYVDWRDGIEVPTARAAQVALAVPDYPRYWALEFLAAGPTPDFDLLLERVRREFTTNSEARPLLQSLEGQILACLGENGKARELQRKAVGAARIAGRFNAIVRSHVALIEQRMADASVACPLQRR